eukprot:gnl/Hemi2/18124_TR5990_c0_g1_i1.p1 gnl/Hemi2/18124_TR5990_c0_g1~~gnl/Hemi2/18124_TR5990_c0_g1_i1.p1  ORF type:complete len:604 (+),score=160.65 gnl/Hemi2/18124_TR5990_c0_g1_i1:185-1996(+)
MFGVLSDVTNTYTTDYFTAGKKKERKKRPSSLQPFVLLAENRENIVDEPTATNFGSAKKKRVSFAHASDTRYFLKYNNQLDVYNCQSMEVNPGFGTIQVAATPGSTHCKNIMDVTDDTRHSMEMTRGFGTVKVAAPDSIPKDSMEFTGDITQHNCQSMEITRGLSTGEVSDSSSSGGDDSTGSSYHDDDDTMDYTDRIKRMRISDFNFGSIQRVMQEYAQNPPSPPPPAPLMVQEFMQLAAVNKFLDDVTGTSRVEGSSTAAPTTPVEVLHAEHIDSPLDALFSQAFKQLDAAAAAASEEISACEAAIAETNPAVFRELRAASGPGLMDVQNKVKRLKFSCYTAAQTVFYEWRERLELQMHSVLSDQLEKLKNELWGLASKARPPVPDLSSEAKASLERLGELADRHDLLTALTGVELLKATSEHVVLSLGSPSEKALEVSVRMADKSITAVDCHCLVNPLASPFKHRLLVDADCASLLSSARLPNQLPGVVREAGFRINRVEALVAEVKVLSERFPVTHGSSSSSSSITVDFCNPATSVYNSVTFPLSWVYPFADKHATVECKGSGMLPSIATQNLAQELQATVQTFGWLTAVCHKLQTLWC